MLLIRPLLQTNSERRHVVHTVVFFIFLVASYAETNRLPFDLPEAELEAVCDIDTEQPGNFRPTALASFDALFQLEQFRLEPHKVAAQRLLPERHSA